MKTIISIKALRPAAWVLAAILSLTLAGEARAQNGVSKASAAKETIANDSAEAGLLRQAYALLSVADHDYKGHRVRAMKQIEAAGKVLGISLRGDGKVHEPQGTSDAQLRSAEALLQQASAGLRGRGLKHIQQACEQLNVALAIR
jgi:hypothetical protein